MTKKPLPKTPPLPDRSRDAVPRVALVLTESTIYVTHFHDRGAPQLTYPVTAGDVANVFNRFGADTGLLPAETLFWQSHGGKMRIGIYLPPAKRTLAFAIGRRVTKITIPLPGFVFAGSGVEYEIHAVRVRPTRPADGLYRAPLPNVSGNGHICFGNTHPPKCGPETIAQAAQLFFESEFNDHLSEGKIASLARREHDDGDELDAPAGFDVEAALDEAEIDEDDEDDEDVDGDTPDGYHGHETVAVLPRRPAVVDRPRRRVRGRPRPVQSLLAYLRTLAGKRRFPEGELVPSSSMSQFLRGGA